MVLSFIRSPDLGRLVNERLLITLISNLFLPATRCPVVWPFFHFFSASSRIASWWHVQIPFYTRESSWLSVLKPLKRKAPGKRFNKMPKQIQMASFIAKEQLIWFRLNFSPILWWCTRAKPKLNFFAFSSFFLFILIKVWIFTPTANSSLIF